MNRAIFQPYEGERRLGLDRLSFSHHNVACFENRIVQFTLNQQAGGLSDENNQAQ
jgi:hypothetical protein